MPAQTITPSHRRYALMIHKFGVQLAVLHAMPRYAGVKNVLMEITAAALDRCGWRGSNSAPLWAVVYAATSEVVGRPIDRDSWIDLSLSASREEADRVLTKIIAATVAIDAADVDLTNRGEW